MACIGSGWNGRIHLSMRPIIPSMVSTKKAHTTHRNTCCNFLNPNQCSNHVLPSERGLSTDTDCSILKGVYVQKTVMNTLQK